jgi:hypothetical protein
MSTCIFRFTIFCSACNSTTASFPRMFTIILMNLSIISYQILIYFSLITYFDQDLDHGV